MADEWAVLPGGEEKKDEEEGNGGVLGGAPNDGDDDDDFHDDGRGSVLTSFTAAAPVSHIDDDGNNNNSESTFSTLTWMTSWFSSHRKHSEFWRIYLGYDHEPTPTPQDHQDDFQENVDDASDSSESDEQEDDASDSSDSDEQEDDASDSSDSDMNSVFSPLFDDFTTDYNYAPQDTKRQTFRIRTTPSQDDKRCLPEDTFSFLIYSPVLKSRAFNLALFVFLFQMGVYAVLSYDIIDVSNKKNPFKLPVNVETPVRFAEALAIFIAIITQDEVRNAINLLRDGFDQDLLPEAFPGATKAKWGWCIFFHGAVGVFGLLLTFLLIMQSTTVLDLLLNFLAMEFASNLDDVVFVLTKEGFLGFLGREVQDEAKKVSNTYYTEQSNAPAPATEQSDPAGSCCDWRSIQIAKINTWLSDASCVTNAYFIILFLIMYVAWGVIFVMQYQGRYLCSKIFVQFGDDERIDLGLSSGLFYRLRRPFYGRASYYRAFNRRGEEWVYLLAWCSNETRWTLSLKMKIDQGTWDPCSPWWYAASSESEDFDVLTTANSWVVRTQTASTSTLDGYGGDGVIVPLSHHFMACYECMNIDNFCGNNGYCTRDRDGMYDQCKCKEGFYGLRCEYPEPCRTLEINPHGEGFGGGNVASKYYRLESADAYNRPVYTSLDFKSLGYSSHDLDGIIVDYSFIAFTGVRWILSEHWYLSWLLFDFTILASNQYSILFKSEPVYTGTGVDVTASPLKVRWHKNDLKDSLPIASSFFCAERCDNYWNETFTMKLSLATLTCEQACRLVDICGHCPGRRHDCLGNIFPLRPTNLPSSPPSEISTSIPSGSGN